MSARSERHAWHRFREVMAARQAEFDGQVPVALLILGVCHGCDEHPTPPVDEGQTDVHLDAAIAVLRPPGMPLDLVIELFERTARELRDGSITL